MANLSEDIQCVGSNTRPPMLDRTDFASWQQRIRLYCQGKENGMLLEGYELTKEDHESQMYDDFEHFRQNKGETIHDYYVRFAKLINDMRNIKMTMSRMQLNSKFVNNMLPEWGRFVIAVKLNRGLRDSNYDQMDDKTEVKGTMQGVGAAGNRGVQNRVRNANPDKMLLMQAWENGVVLDEEQLLFLTGGQDNVVDDDVDEPPVQDLALNVDNIFQDDECDALDYDVDEDPTAQTMFLANLSSAEQVYDKAGPSHDLDILSEVHDHDNYQDAICEHHEYAKENALPVVQSNVSSVSNDAYMAILNEVHEQAA
ncbi:hypothetical protein Tco_1190308 [Tanacetum coccineum]